MTVWDAIITGLFALAGILAIFGFETKKKQGIQPVNF